MTNGRRGSATSVDPPIAAPERRRDLLERTAVKAALRKEAKARRASVPAAAREPAAEAIAARALAALPFPRGAAVSGYVPVAGEANPMPLLVRLADRGHRLALPAVRDRGLPLAFRAWTPGDDLVAGWYGIPCPPDSAPELAPDVVLLPLLAFDRRGHRLGHGAGFYDRSLAALRRRRPVLAVGVGFACQELAEIPAEAHDQPLDWIVTDDDAMSWTDGYMLAIEAG